MFQFTGFPSIRYGLAYGYMDGSMQVSPFRYLRINGYLLLPEAFRSLSRLSSALSAKASALRSLYLDHLVCCCVHSPIACSCATIPVTAFLSFRQFSLSAPPSVAVSDCFLFVLVSGNVTFRILGCHSSDKSMDFSISLSGMN